MGWGGPEGTRRSGRRRADRSWQQLGFRALVGSGLAGVLVVLLMAAVNAFSVSPTPPPGPAPRIEDTVDRAFSADSWWNASLPDQAPLHPAGEEILEYLSTGQDSGDGCLWFSGADHSPWGQPVYWAERSDPVYEVAPRGAMDFPPELASLRIPRGASPAFNDDGSMTVYDVHEGYVVALSGAQYDAGDDTWTATGATVTYLDSNGLHAATGRSDDSRNRGTHRGNNGATMAVMWHEVRAGAIEHVLKIAVGPDVANRAVFPMVGSDGEYEGGNPAVPAQGLRLRISPDVDLESAGLSDDVLVIARALQDYGVYVGDSGGRTALKLESTLAEGRGQLWNIRADALCGLPFSPEYWDVLAEDFDPSR